MYKGYDAEWINGYIRESIGGDSQIPVRKSHEKYPGYYRKEMFKNPNRKNYR